MSLSKIYKAAKIATVVPVALLAMKSPQIFFDAPEVIALDAFYSVTDEAEEASLEVDDQITLVVLKGATEKEQMVVDALQARGISDPNAIATVLGNIEQESRWKNDVCEGGARGPYRTCRRGGFGLIQWTTHGRYDGLGRHATKHGLAPESMEAQLSYLFSETEWKKIEAQLKQPGFSISRYMQLAHRWLGWGIHGNRTHYSQQYAQRLTVVQVPASECPTLKYPEGHIFRV
ncbi:MAG: hypothetical protein EB168_11710 [Euryarchaeota archaeon]|nr:hypothetical protein [Euryarchaeota archaeon]